MYRQRLRLPYSKQQPQGLPLRDLIGINSNTLFKSGFKEQAKITHPLNLSIICFLCKINHRQSN